MQSMLTGSTMHFSSISLSIVLTDSIRSKCITSMLSSADEHYGSKKRPMTNSCLTMNFPNKSLLDKAPAIIVAASRMNSLKPTFMISLFDNNMLQSQLELLVILCFLSRLAGSIS